MQLWTWQKKGFSLSDPERRVDSSTYSDYYKKHKEIFERLWKIMGTSQLLWCFAEKEEAMSNASKLEYKGKVLWELDVPAKHIRYNVCSIAWHWILHGCRCHPPIKLRRYWKKKFPHRFREIENEFPAESDSNGLTVTAHLTDSDGAIWEIRRKMRSGPIDGIIAVDVRIQVDTDRDVMCIPWLTIFPGLDTFGQGKNQALFAGLEYLSDEPSSSEADISAPGNVRRVPDPAKVTLPLMTISAEGRYIGLVWEPSEWISPMFDSPDRIFGSGAHVMTLTGPAVGKNRFENSLVAHTPIRFAANEPVTARMWIIGGEDNWRPSSHYHCYQR